MGKPAQIALGAVIAVAVAAASVHADGTLFGDRSLSHWQNAQLDANAKINVAAAEFTSGVRDLIHSIMSGSH